MLQSFRIARLPNSPKSSLSKEQIWQAAKKQLFSQFLTQPITAALLFPLFAHFGSAWHSNWKFWRQVLSVAFAAFVNDALFYFFHVILHTPYLMRKVHSVHHSFVTTTSVAAEHAHILEIVVGNQLPVVIVPLFLGFPFPLWLSWLALRLLRTYATHSGYAFPLLMPEMSVHHDHHHQTASGNFGGTPLLDLWLGTYNPSWAKSAGYIK
jgi:sterol desaturase/sphingolipid hydroxylase (fatty acid hydroxylase superfamily)